MTVDTMTIFRLTSHAGDACMVQSCPHAHQEVGACAGDEAQGVVAWLHVLPEVHIGVVEDVGVQVEVVEALG